MKKTLWLILFLACPLPLLAEESEVYLQLDAEAYAEPVTIRAFTGDWKGDFKGGNKAFLDARAESGVRYGRSTVALTWRYVYQLDFSEDTARVYYQYKNRLAPQPGEERQLAIDARHYRADGLRLAHDFALGDSSWLLETGLNLLKAQELTDGSLQGNAVFEGGVIAPATIRSLSGEINYHYSRPLLHEEELDWRPPEPQGSGYSLDLALKGDFSERLHLQARVNDVLGYLYWDDVPATRYTVACQCSQGTYDATGQLQIDDRYRQRLPFAGQARLAYDLDRSWQGFARLMSNPLVNFAALGLEYRRESWSGSLAFEPQTSALELRLQGKYAGLRWLADKLDSGDAHRLAASLYAQYRW